MSFGGVIAQRLAPRHPARVRTLTTFAAGPSDARLLTVMVPALIAAEMRALADRRL